MQRSSLRVTMAVSGGKPFSNHAIFGEPDVSWIFVAARYGTQMGQSAFEKYNNIWRKP